MTVRKTIGYGLIAASFVVAAYIPMAQWMNDLNASRMEAALQTSVMQLDKQSLEAILDNAHAYNQKLEEDVRWQPDNHMDKEYYSQLDTGSGNLIGMLEIDKIDVDLPIYLGISEEDLAQGVCHLEGSSLPVGGAGTHAVLNGHSGYPGVALLSRLDELEIGDTFSLTVAGQTLTYEVDQISVVDPDDFSKLTLESGKDYVTLVTCTPYGINTQRLLVRGIRTNLVFPKYVSLHVRQYLNLILISLFAFIGIYIYFRY
jgi:sortase A